MPDVLHSGNDGADRLAVVGGKAQRDVFGLERILGDDGIGERFHVGDGFALGASKDHERLVGQGAGDLRIDEREYPCLARNSRAAKVAQLGEHRAEKCERRDGIWSGGDFGVEGGE